MSQDRVTGVEYSSEDDGEYNSNSDIDSEYNSEFDSEFDSEYYDSEHESENEAKRRKISEDGSEYDSEIDSDSDNEDDDYESINESEGILIKKDVATQICHTDKDGHIICHARQKIREYEFQSILGEGAFGRVLRVKNCITGQNAALKVIKNEMSKRKSAMMEIIALTTITCRDPDEESLCIKMLKWFNYGGHICIAFPLLGISVFDFLKDNNFEPFSVSKARHIAYQLCIAVAFLHKNGMTHTDLKPENILFVNSSYTTLYDDKKQKAIRHPISTDIRLIDFGNVTRDNDVHYSVISTRYYRAPEVILHLGWTYSCDTWSLGCTLFEIYYGNLLFPTHDDREHLAMMERVLGPIPSKLMNSTNTRFFKNGTLDWNWNEAQEDFKNYCAPLREYLLADREEDNELFDLIGKMLEWEPTKRISMNEALEHSFLKKLSSNQRM